MSPATKERTRRANLARLSDRADAWRMDHWAQSIPMNRAPGQTISERDRQRLAFHGLDQSWRVKSAVIAQRPTMAAGDCAE